MSHPHDHDHDDHDHDHDHHHGHHHHHGPSNYNVAFALGVALNTGFVLLEVVYGFLSGSLALIADAGHNLSDVLGLLLAWGAATLATKKPSKRFTYGLRSSSILAALANSIFLMIAIGGIAWEAIQRFSENRPVEGSTVIVVAAIGILVNGATALLFMSGRKKDLNLRGAYLHMLSDAVVSAGVVIAGVAIIYTNLRWIDPTMSLVVCAVIVVGTWGLLKDSIKLALAAVPDSIDPSRVATFLKGCKGVTEVHDLHIWGMSTTETALTAHLLMPGGHPGDDFLGQVCHDLEHEYGIHHVTIQIECGDGSKACGLAPDEVI